MISIRNIDQLFIYYIYYITNYYIIILYKYMTQLGIEPQTSAGIICETESYPAEPWGK